MKGEGGRKKEEGGKKLEVGHDESTPVQIKALLVG